MKFSQAFIFALTTSICVVANANADSVYYPEQGTIVLPNLKVNGQIYSIVLKQLPGTIDFRVDETSIENVSLIEENGSPSSPKLTAFNGSNTLSNDVFFNYYRVDAAAGQKLIVHTKLNQPMSDVQKRRCLDYPATAAKPSRFDTQIHVYSSSLERIGGLCGEDLTFEFPVAGTYILHFDYANQSEGYFNAAIL